MPSIGPYTCTTWKGVLVPARKPMGLVDTSPGVIGYGVSLGAWRADPVDIDTIVNVASVAQAEALREALRSMVSTSVQVVDQFGVTWSPVLVMAAMSTYSISLLNQVRVVTAWKLLVISTIPGGASS